MCKTKYEHSVDGLLLKFIVLKNIDRRNVHYIKLNEKKAINL